MLLNGQISDQSLEFKNTNDSKGIAASTDSIPESSTPSSAGIAATTGWRNSVRIHPAADGIPEASEDEKRALAADLAQHGQRQPIILVQVGTRPKQLLDGRTRLDLLSAAGVDVVDANGKVLIHHRTIQVANDAEAECLSLSLNLHRRHLTSEQKRNLIAQQLKATPEKSNRQIAKTAKVDDKTVGTVRRELESTAEIPQLEKTLGADGKVRKQPASKPCKATKPQASRKGPNLEPCDAEEAAALAADEQQKARNKDVGECISDVVAHVGLAAMSIDDSRQRGNLSGPLHRAINFAVGVSQFRDDIGANSTNEITCKDAEIEELRSAKRQLEIKIGGLESEIADLKAENATLRIENHALREKLGGRLTTKPNTAGWRKWSKEKAADMVLQQQRWNYANPDDLCDLRTMEKIRNFHGLRPKLAESIAA